MFRWAVIILFLVAIVAGILSLGTEGGSDDLAGWLREGLVGAKNFAVEQVRSLLNRID